MYRCFHGELWVETQMLSLLQKENKDIAVIDVINRNFCFFFIFSKKISLEYPSLHGRIPVVARKYPSLRFWQKICGISVFFQICCCWSVLQHMLRYVCTDCPPSPVSHVRLHHQALVIQCLTSGLLRCHPWVSHYVDAEFRRATAYSCEEGHHSIRDFYVCQEHHKTIK